MKINENKRIQAILFFAMKSPNNEINRLKLMKLLWLADRIHLNRYGRTILRDQYCALPHGPVPSSTMDLTEESKEDLYTVDAYVIKAEDKCNPKYFSRSDIEVLEEVWEEYGYLTDKVLRNFSHYFPEWKRFEKELNDPNLPKSYPMVMDDFFKDPEIKVNYKIDLKRSEFSRDIYNSNNQIQEILSR